MSGRLVAALGASLTLHGAVAFLAPWATAPGPVPQAEPRMPRLEMATHAVAEGRATARRPGGERGEAAVPGGPLAVGSAIPSGQAVPVPPAESPLATAAPRATPRAAVAGRDLALAASEPAATAAAASQPSAAGGPSVAPAQPAAGAVPTQRSLGSTPAESVRPSATAVSTTSPQGDEVSIVPPANATPTVPVETAEASPSSPVVRAAGPAVRPATAPSPIRPAAPAGVARAEAATDTGLVLSVAPAPAATATALAGAATRSTATLDRTEANSPTTAPARPGVETALAVRATAPMAPPVIPPSGSSPKRVVEVAAIPLRQPEGAPMAASSSSMEARAPSSPATVALPAEDDAPGAAPIQAAAAPAEPIPARVPQRDTLSVLAAAAPAVSWPVPSPAEAVPALAPDVARPAADSGPGARVASAAASPDRVEAPPLAPPARASAPESVAPAPLVTPVATDGAERAARPPAPEGPRLAAAPAAAMAATFAFVPSEPAPAATPHADRPEPASGPRPALAGAPPAPGPALRRAAAAAAVAPRAELNPAAREAVAPPAERAAADGASLAEGPDGDVDPVSIAALQAFLPQSPGAGASPARDAIASLLAEVPCARLQAEFLPETGALELRGHVPEAALRGPVLAALREAVGASIPVRDDVLVLPPPQCRVLPGIEILGLPQSSEQHGDPRLVGQGTHARVFRYREGDRLLLEATAPRYEAHLYLDY